MNKENFTPDPRDPCVFVNLSPGIFCAVYVDDILSAGKNHKVLLAFLKWFGKMFSVRHLGKPTMFLGIEINYFQEGGFCNLSQFTYVQKLASKFLTLAERAHPPTVPVEANVNDLLFAADSEPIFEGPYRELVGGLLYVTVCTRPDNLLLQK